MNDDATDWKQLYEEERLRRERLERALQSINRVATDMLDAIRQKGPTVPLPTADYEHELSDNDFTLEMSLGLEQKQATMHIFNDIAEIVANYHEGVITVGEAGMPLVRFIVEDMGTQWYLLEMDSEAQFPPAILTCTKVMAPTKEAATGIFVTNLLERLESAASSRPASAE